MTNQLTWMPKVNPRTMTFTMNLRANQRKKILFQGTVKATRVLMTMKWNVQIKVSSRLEARIEIKENFANKFFLRSHLL